MRETEVDEATEVVGVILEGIAVECARASKPPPLLVLKLRNEALSC